MRKKYRNVIIIFLFVLALILTIVFLILDHSGPKKVLSWKYELIFPVGTDVQTIENYAQKHNWESVGEYDLSISSKNLQYKVCEAEGLFKDGLILTFVLDHNDKLKRVLVTKRYYYP